MSRLSASIGRLSGGSNKGILAGLDPQGGFGWASSSTVFLPSQPFSKPEALAFLKSPWAAQHLAINVCGSLYSLTDRVWHFQLVSPSDIKKLETSILKFTDVLSPLHSSKIMEGV